MNSEEWLNLAENMRIANGAMPDFSKMKSDLQEISAILNNLDFGSVISEEDYARLIAYESTWKDLFIL
jgi:hypothetical protein